MKCKTVVTQRPHNITVWFKIVLKVYLPYAKTNMIIKGFEFCVILSRQHKWIVCDNK